jgi:transcriptional regulator with XRE-family HTH domain
VKGQKRMQKTLKEIRQAMGYSVRGFAELIGYQASSYQHYESGRRTLTQPVLIAAQNAYTRDRQFFEHMLPARVDEISLQQFPNGIVSEL